MSPKSVPERKRTLISSPRKRGLFRRAFLPAVKSTEPVAQRREDVGAVRTNVGHLGGGGPPEALYHSEGV